VDINPDHLFLAHASMQFIRVAVLRQEQIVGKGFYAPLMFSGQLLVDDLAVSFNALLWLEHMREEI